MQFSGQFNKKIKRESMEAMQLLVSEGDFVGRGGSVDGHEDFAGFRFFLVVGQGELDLQAGWKMRHKISL